MSLICAYTNHWFASFIVVILLINIIITFFFPIKGEKNALGLNITSDKDYITSSEKRNNALMWANTIALIAHMIIVIGNYDYCKKQEKLDFVRDIKDIVK